nr:MAG TPA: hypothetical protein [Caudoviricetes sp.]
MYGFPCFNNNPVLDRCQRFSVFKFSLYLLLFAFPYIMTVSIDI